MIRRLTAASIELSDTPRDLVRDARAVGAVEKPSLSDGESGGVDIEVGETEAYRAAYLEGFDAGYADGDKDARSKLESAERQFREKEEESARAYEHWRNALVETSAQLETVHQEVLADAEALAVEIAFAALCRIVGDMQKKHAVVERMCRKLIAERGPTAPCIRVSREDFPELPEMEDGLLWEIDASLGSGECVIRTAQGDIDASLSVQLASIMRALLSGVSKSGASA